MGFPKEFSDNNIEELSYFFMGLSLPVRISILKILLEKETWLTHEEFACLNLTNVTRDRHLHALTELKLIEKIHHNGAMCFKINEPVFSKMKNGFNLLFDVNKTDKSEAVKLI